MPHTHLRFHADFFQALFLRAQISTELGIGGEQARDVFFAPDEISINRRWFRHDVQQRDRRACAGGDLSG